MINNIYRVSFCRCCIPYCISCYSYVYGCLMLHSNHPALKSYQKYHPRDGYWESLHLQSWYKKSKPQHSCNLLHFQSFNCGSNTNNVYTKSEINHAPKVHLLPKILLRTAIKLFILFVLFCFHFCNLWVTFGVLHLIWSLQNVSFSLNM